MGISDWFDDRASDIANLSSGAWTAIAAWLAVCVTVAALVYAWRQFQASKDQGEDLAKPNVAMFMEPSAGDWHIVELVVKNFGQKPAFGIKFEFATPPTVPRYESADADNYVDIVPLKLPAEIPYLAPSQEWRTVWDSALDRKQLGESIGSRFAGAVTFSDQPASGKAKQKPAAHRYRTPAVLDWSTLHPVERLELLTNHDLARQEKQKLELLRGLLTYYHYATTESRHEVLQAEINRMNAAANEQRDRYRSQFAVEQETPQQAPPPAPEPPPQAPPPPAPPSTVAAPAPVEELPPPRPEHRYENQLQFDNRQRFDGLPPEYDDPPPPYDEEPPYDDDEADTRVINGRHRRSLR